MRCQFQLRYLPVAMRPLVAAGNSHVRGPVLRQLASLGLDAVNSGLDLRTRCALLCDAGDSADGSVMVKIPDTSPLAQALLQMEASFATRRGVLLALLAIVGWERSSAPASGPAVTHVPSQPVAPLARVEPVRAVPAPPAQPVSPANLTRSVAPLSQPESADSVATASTAEDARALNAAGEKLLQDFEF